MKYHKISKLLNDSTVSKFVTRKCIEVNDLSGGEYFISKNIRFKSTMLRSDLCNYSDAYMVVKGTIAVEDTNDANKRKKLVLNNNAPFGPCISKFNNTLIDNFEELDIKMPIYNLLEYSKIYSMTQEVSRIII